MRRRSSNITPAQSELRFRISSSTWHQTEGDPCFHAATEKDFCFTGTKNCAQMSKNQKIIQRSRSVFDDETSSCFRGVRSFFCDAVAAVSSSDLWRAFVFVPIHRYGRRAACCLLTLYSAVCRAASHSQDGGTKRNPSALITQQLRSDRARLQRRALLFLFRRQQNRWQEEIRTRNNVMKASSCSSSPSLARLRLLWVWGFFGRRQVHIFTEKLMLDHEKPLSFTLSSVAR